MLNAIFGDSNVHVIMFAFTAEWLTAWDTLTMLSKLWSVAGNESDSRPGHYVR